MKTIRTSGFETNQPIDDIRVIGVSFFTWGVLFGFGAWIIARQLSKIVPSASNFTQETALLLGLAAFGLMLGIHFIRAKVLRNNPEYSIKFLALPGVILLVELAIFWVFRL